MDFETIILKKEEGIATIILNRPDKGNSLSHQMLEELVAALDEVARDKEVRVLILTGAGRGFCGGGDTSELGEGGIYNQGVETNRQFIRQVTQKITLSLRRLEIPTIAMVNGFAAGGGLEYACACDIRIGSENARFASAFVSVGLTTETGGHYLLPGLWVWAKPSKSYILATGLGLRRQRGSVF